MALPSVMAAYSGVGSRHRGACPLREIRVCISGGNQRQSWQELSSCGFHGSAGM